MRQSLTIGLVGCCLLWGTLSQPLQACAETPAMAPSPLDTNAGVTPPENVSMPLEEQEAQQLRDQRVASPQGGLTDAIDKVRQQGLMTVYRDGQFHPERSLTRAELATLLVKTFRLNTREVTNPLSVLLNDVPPTHWAASDIETVVHQGIMSGYRPHLFYPNQAVTRAEAYAIFAQAYGVQQLENTAVNLTLSQYLDADQVPVWSKKAIATALKNGFVETLPPAKLHPLQPMTRGSMAIALNQYLIRLNQPEP